MGAIKTENFASVEITNEQDLWIWLSNNFGSQESVWLITYKKSTPQKYLSRQQVLDALIAYGWIDGIRRKLDDQRTMQLISQRKTQSWSATYKQRAERISGRGPDATRGARRDHTIQAVRPVGCYARCRCIGRSRRFANFAR